MSDMWKAIATGTVTLVVGFVLLQIQLGGRRPRLRREIQEELELLKQFDKGLHPAAHARLSARVAVLLGRYEPDPDVEQEAKDTWQSSASAFAVATTLAVSIAGALPDARWWVLASIGAAVGTLGVVLSEVFRARARRQSLEKAVEAELSGEATIAATAHATATGVVSTDDPGEEHPDRGGA